MRNNCLSEKCLSDLKNHLLREKKSRVTIEKYMHDVRDFYVFVNDRLLTKDIVIEYKMQLTEKYAVRSVNSKLASINSLLVFLGREDCRVKSLKLSVKHILQKKKSSQRLNTLDYYKRLKIIQGFI